MGYYMRFIATDAQPIDFGKLGQSLKQEDALYALEYEENEGDVLYKGDAIGHIEINQPGDGLFDEEIEELKEFLEEAEGRAKKRVRQTLEQATRIVAVQVLGGSEPEATLGRLDPVWSWLFEHHQGLLQADAEGYYDADELILEVD